ncbi:MAG TPA: LysR family transcriptional regulator [Polyangiaceae bacterium]|nr:LysR family transcriptional regulator [Polyangiaceae bacterium]
MEPAGKRRDLAFDLNLLRVFLLVAETGSVTLAASRLYLTQPAVSAALRRLTRALGAPLFTRAGRGLALTARGRKLFGEVRPHLHALLDAAHSSGDFEPNTSTRNVRLGLSDQTEAWLLGPLLRAFMRDAPSMTLVVLPVQFRNVAEALASSRVDLAVTVADELPADVRRKRLFMGTFVCLFDPRHARLGPRPTREAYLAADHVVVSYNADTRGIVEDALGVRRRVRLSLPSFEGIGGVVAGSALVATVPLMTARAVVALRPELRTAPVPLPLGSAPTELLWRDATHDDPALAFVREAVTQAAKAATA